MGTDPTDLRRQRIFKKLAEKLQRLTREPVAYDPSHLDDSVAMQTDWTPAKAGGASFRTHRLVEANASRMEFRASAGAIAFYLLFLLSGLVVIIGFSAANLSSGGFSFSGATALPLFVGVVFATLGGCMLYFGAAPIVFDKRSDAFWKGRTAPYEAVNRAALKHFTELDEIHALQLISEFCRSDKSSYYSYELNLVLKDARRINVVDHGNQEQLREDARTLSAFLEAPVWDAT